MLGPESGSLNKPPCPFPLPPPEAACHGEVVLEQLKHHHPMKCMSTSKIPKWNAPHSRQASALPSVFTKSRRRKAVFRCTNGTSYSEEMETATECGCANCLL
ncbi:hypothetical protein NHX12_011822 [Muraenolepis orangiensis]|uniref:Uncharacterized protein n=1 Tax=Muraenolepis orangiensis TaxID=630683 RepID=A0A9Q0DIP2_9TELE|nr:hypothetical protein NHX12_011822 [Muraenolepis orangiensis]